MSVQHLASLDAEQHILRSRHSLNKEAISETARIFHTPQMHNLLHSTNSGVLLVNGYSDRSQHGKISPLTNVCATLTQALRQSSTDNITLAFFCGQHTSSQDDLTGPQGLMRSLIAFLVLSLVEHRFLTDDDQVWFPNVQEDLEELCFRDLCEVFSRLVQYIPEHTNVYCIVEGISWYEREEWADEYRMMFECLEKLTTDSAVGAAFKVLLTCPTFSQWLPAVLNPGQIISVRNLRRRR